VAQTKKKRHRKHRGTQGGRVDERPKGRPRNRAEARQQAKARRSGSGGKRTVASQSRGLQPPSWGSAFTKGLFAAALFLGLLVVVLGRGFGASAAIAGAMVLFYTPMAYYLDLFFYNRRLRQVTKEKTGA
jgi:hypothetical protein